MLDTPEFIQLLGKAQEALSSEYESSVANPSIGLSLIIEALEAFITELDKLSYRQAQSKGMTFGRRVEQLFNEKVIPSRIRDDCFAIIQTRNILAHSLTGVSLMSIDMAADLARLKSNGSLVSSRMRRRPKAFCY